MDTETKLKTAIAFTAPMICALPAAYIAYSIRDHNAKIRFTAGLISSGFYLNTIKKHVSPIIFDFLTTESERRNSNSWMYYHTIYHLLLTSAHISFFGANEYYAKHNITNVKQALIASIFPAQVYFIDEKDKKSKPVKERCLSLLKELVKIVGCAATTKLICSIIQEYHLLDKITSSPIVHMEVLALLKSLSNPSRNLPAIVLGLIFCNQLEVNVPYSFTYFLASPRVFWKNWSKPAGEYYKYFLYKPLGGRNNAMLATMSLFMVNCYGHIQLSKALYGDKNMDKVSSGWVKAFGVMGASVALEIVAEKMCSGKLQESMFWKAAWFSVLHLSMDCTLWWIREHSLVVNIPFFCGNCK